MSSPQETPIMGRVMMTASPSSRTVPSAATETFEASPSTAPGRSLLFVPTRRKRACTVSYLSLSLSLHIYIYIYI